MKVFDSEIPNELHTKYGKMSLQEIIKLYEDSWDRESGDVKPPFYEIPEYLAYTLRVLSYDVANECIGRELANLHSRIDEIEVTAKKHRHKTIMGLYTEKPSW